MLSLLLSSTLLFAISANAQTCYYSAGEAADDQYIPCSSTSGFTSCCLDGDTCLGQNACFGAASGVTYIAGCTDSDYSDSTCGAQTCNKDSQFVGLSTCNGNNWVCCTGDGQTGDFPSKDHGDCGSCDDAVTLFSGMGSLPSYTAPSDDSSSTSSSSSAKATKSSSSSSQDEQKTSSTVDATPAATSSSAASTSADDSSTSKATTKAKSSPSVVTVTNSGSISLSTSPTSATAAAASSTSTSDPTASASHGMSTGEKVGIAIGVILGVAFLLTIVAFLIRLFRHRGVAAPPNNQDLSTAVWQGDISGGASGVDPAAGAGFRGTKNDMEHTAYGATAFAPVKQEMQQQQHPYTPNSDSQASPPPTYHPAASPMQQAQGGSPPQQFQQQYPNQQQYQQAPQPQQYQQSLGPQRLGSPQISELSSPPVSDAGHGTGMYGGR